MNAITQYRYKEIAKEYGLKCHIVKPNDKWCKANGIDQYTNNSCCSPNEIWVGIFENKEWEIASFFHEIGHIMIRFTPPSPTKWNLELDAWLYGLREAQKYGYFISPETFDEFIVPCLNSYKD